MAACTGSYTEAVRTHPVTGAASCRACGRRFDRANLAGEAKVNVPLHSPDLSNDAPVTGDTNQTCGFWEWYLRQRP
jgi:hypothetical protein